MTAIGLPAFARPATARLPFVVAGALVLLVWLLPFHSLLMATLLGALGWPSGTVRVLASWKELLVLALAGWALTRATVRSVPATGIAPPDVAITALIGIATLFLLLETSLFRAPISLGAELYGFRDAVFFMLLYYVGRATPEITADDRVLRHLFHLAVILAVIAIFERIFVSPDVLVIIGVATYMNDFLGIEAFTQGNKWGLPQNYWTNIGGIPVRRAGSVFLHSQGFALPFLLLMPAATAWVMNRREGLRLIPRLAYALIWIGLALSLTRMTIAICVIQTALFYLVFRKPEWAAATSVIVMTLFAVAMMAVPGLFGFVWETLTWQSDSSSSHMREWINGIVAFSEQPWGHGLGTTDHVAVRFGMAPITGDNMFFSYAVQLGLFGLLAQLGALLTLLAAAWFYARKAATDGQRRVGVVLSLATLGILMNGATSLVFSSIFLAYAYFWLAGSVVTNSERLRLTR